MNLAASDSTFRERTAQPAYLAKLNDEQRQAVEHGDGKVAGPLLVIAGAGSGKTSTLAHRVAHLIVKGADPRRILLLTFSRRAAQEMERRAARLLSGGRARSVAATGAGAGAADIGLTWAGTFHAVANRL